MASSPTESQEVNVASLQDLDSLMPWFDFLLLRLSLGSYVLSSASPALIPHLRR